MGRSDKNKGAWHCGLCPGRFDNNQGLSVHMGRRHRGHVPIGTTNRRAQRADDTLDDEGYQPDREEQSSKRKRSLPALSGPALSVRSGDHSSSSDESQSSESERGRWDESSVYSSRGSGDDSGSEDDVVVMQPIQPLGAPLLQPVTLPPYDTGMYALPKVVKPATSKMPWSVAALGGWMVKNCSNGAGTDLIQILKDSRWDSTLLPAEAATCIRRIEAQMATEVPQAGIILQKLDLSSLQNQPPPKAWRNAAVTSRGVLNCVLSATVNSRTYDFEQLLKVIPGGGSPYPVGVAEEPFYSEGGRRGYAEAVARGVALGWAECDIHPQPFIFSADDLSPDNAMNRKLSPLAIVAANLPLTVRQSIMSGEHVCLFPNLPLGKNRTASLKRDWRCAMQKSFQVFADDFNDLYKRGYVIHGSQIKNCPHNRPLLGMPYLLGSGYDAAGAWVWVNSKFFHCYVCCADYDTSWLHPDSGQLLSPQLAEPAVTHRRIANDAASTLLEKRAARAALKALHLNPEITALDSIAMVQMGGQKNVYPDVFHCFEAGTIKHAELGIKSACGDASSVSGMGHSASMAAALIDDFVACCGLFNNGYLRLPGVKSFTSIHVFSGMMVRSLAFCLLAALLSVPDIFVAERQTAMTKVLALCVLLIRHGSARRWDACVPDKIDAIFVELQGCWGDAIGEWVNFERIKNHLIAHWRSLYLELGTPVQWSTMHFIEALQRVLKAAWKRTNKVNPEVQVLKRISLVRYVDSVLMPSLGLGAGPVAALLADRPTQAYLRGSVKSIPGVNTVHDVPVGPVQTAWNAAVLQATKISGHLPRNHICRRDRMYPRGSCFVVRDGLCAVSVPAFPSQCSEKGLAAHAIFSVFDVSAGAGVAAANVVSESPVKRFIVDFYVSYDITGLSIANPNAAPTKCLAVNEQNSSENAIDLAFGRWINVLPSVAPHFPERAFASDLFQRVKPVNKLAVLEIGQLCQPLMSFPVLHDAIAAKAFFDGASSKWDADEWLICPWLY